MLNCNTHLYLANPENWKHHNNDTFSNSTHDMICVGVQHLKAIRGPKQDERSSKGTLHFRFVPDEHLQYSNVGFGIIEGLAYTDREIPAYVRERNVFRIKIICFGNTRDGTRSQENNTEFTLKDVSTVNTTAMLVGIKNNVILEKFVTNVEIRIISTTAQLEAGLHGWMLEPGEWEMVQKETQGFNERDEFTIEHKTDGEGNNGMDNPFMNKHDELNFNQLGFGRGTILEYIQKPVETPHLEYIEESEAKTYLVNGYML